MQSIVLASSSTYRQQALARLGLPFATSSPSIDESRQAGESAEAMVRRLAIEKARVVARQHPDAMIIGSDQSAAIDNETLGKPGDRLAAVKQLQCASGRIVDFFTAVCVLSPTLAEPLTHLDRTRVHFRSLTLPEIERYIATELPLSCAGSFKSEGLGITLFERIENDDPSALIGLPLIGLAKLLRQAGVPLP
jgi:septum formation protein